MFCRIPLKLITSYLSNRTHCVNIDDSLSSEQNVTCGIPQGTVLGPLLFNIYVNDLFAIKTQADIISFADDTAIYYQDCSWNNLKRKVENDLLNIMKWFNNRLLTINFNKTFFIPFSRYKDRLPTFNSIQININQEPVLIARKEHIKYLGVLIDSHLNWNFHMEYLGKKLRGMISRFKYYTNIFEEHQLKILYYSLIQSHLIYGITAWGGVTNNYLAHLQNIQKWILKIIYKKPYQYSSETLFDDTRHFDIRQLFFQNLIIKYYKRKEILRDIVHNHETRYKHKSTVVPRKNKTVGQRCHTYLGPLALAEIPESLKRINSLGLFKKKLKSWISEIPRKKIHQIIDRKNFYNTS